MASSALTYSRSYLSLGLSYRSTSGLQDWWIYYNTSLGDFAIKNDRLKLALSRTYTIGVSVPIDNAGSKCRRKVYIS